MSTEARPDQSEHALRHETVLYPSLDAFLATVVPFVLGGLAADEPVLVAVSTTKLALVAEALGEVAARVGFVDLTEQTRNPGLLIPTVLRAFLDQHGTRRTRIVCESLWPGRLPDEIPVVVRQEALINRVFASYPTTILCPYDSDTLPTHLLALAARTHPTVVEGQTRLPCARYAEPETVVEVFNERAPDHSPAAVELSYDEQTLPHVQALVGDYGARVGLPPQRIADLLAALGQVAGSALPAKGEGTVRVTGRDDRLVCEVRTPGRFDDLLAGLRPPAEDTPRGRALCAANLLCDLVETHTHDDSSSTRLLLWY